MLIFVCNEISGNKVRKETKEFRNIQENIEQKKENPMFQKMFKVILYESWTILWFRLWSFSVEKSHI